MSSHPSPAVREALVDAEAALAFAAALVTACGQQAAGAQEGAVEVSKDAPTLAGSVVTDVDVAVEGRIDAALAERFPHDGLVGEEGAQRSGTSGRTWVVDPIDGTLNYARAAGPWSVVLSAFAGDEPVMCALWSGGHVWTASAGGPAWRDGRVLAAGAGAVERGGIVRCPAELAPAVQSGGWLARTCESSAAEVVAVADARFAGVVRLRGDRRDLHGPALIAQQAGARVTDTAGRPWSGASEGLVVAHREAHEALVAIAAAGAHRPGGAARD